MSSCGAFKYLGLSLLSLGLWSGGSRADDLVELTGWADEGLIVRGSGMTNDVFHLIAEAKWDKAAARDPSRYLVRVAYPDGRVDTRVFPVDFPPGRRRFAVYVLAAPLRSQFPSSIKVAVTILDSATGTPVSNTLTAGIEQFPRPKGDASGNDSGPFGWGKPLQGPARVLSNPGPDGLRFARIMGSGTSPGFFLATTEATIGQVAERIKGYDPKAGRSDEFVIEDRLQPAIGLTPAKAVDYLKALGQADPSGIIFRLPTVQEWEFAAKAGKTSAFWWGDEPTFPEGANLLGAEPALAGDSTAPSTPPATSPTFKANPLGLAHTFGNVAEWATKPTGGYARMGGHFRTEPASPLPVVVVAKDDEIGPDPFVGVRAAFDLTAESAKVLVQKRLASDPRLKATTVLFDPDEAKVTLSGEVADSSAVRAADRLLEGLWFVAAVDNRLKTLTLAPNQLATLGVSSGLARVVGVLDRTFVEIPLTVHWLDPLPVYGSEWWVNVYLPGDGHEAYKLDPAEVGRSSKVILRIDRSKLAALGLADDSPVKVALSLGSASLTPIDRRIVSNIADVRPTFPTRSR